MSWIHFALLNLKIRKILRVVYTTNRIEFHKKTLETTKIYDYSGLDVHHIFIDDYPQFLESVLQIYPEMNGYLFKYD